MREWPPDSARGETAREARKMRVSMRVCHATTPERAECVDLRMRHVWSTVRSEHADHSLPDNHGRAIMPHDRGCFVVASGARAGPPATRERTSQPTVDVDRLRTSHNVYQHKRFVTGTRSRSGGSTYDGNTRNEQRRRPTCWWAGAAACTVRTVHVRQTARLVLNHRAPTMGSKKDHVQVWPVRQWERLTSQRARGDRPLVRSRRR